MWIYRSLFITHHSHLNIRLLTKHNLLAWHDMRCKLWPDPPPERAEVGKFYAKKNYIIWLAVSDGGEVVGFLEAQTCNRADGCDSDAILYIEGWFVEENFRGHGVGSELMQAAEAWARAHGIQELASDALIDNHISHRAHKKLGFHEVDKQISYMKKLQEAEGGIEAVMLKSEYKYNIIGILSSIIEKKPQSCKPFVQ